MNPLKYFPLGIAKGDAFCNRVNERKKIIQNVKKGQHTVIISPRRYGKSSLALYCLEEGDFLYTRVDLFVAVNAKTIENQILEGVKNLINKISSVPEQALGILKNYIKSLKSKWIIGTDGISIELIPDKESDPATNIMEALQLLENYLRKKEMKAVFFIDEFQEIGSLANSSGIEGAIRHVAQESESLCFIFSGSNRHILATMFDDRGRPLYMLCDRVSVDRIHESDYTHYINNVAMKTWKKKMEESAIREIFTKTERHPYYMNALCDKLWSDFENSPPAVDDIKMIWREYVMQEESKIAKEISDLSMAQKKLLITIAKGNSKDLSGKIHLRKFDITSAAVTKALRSLEENDYINKDKDGRYFLVDPLLKASLNIFYPGVF